MSEISFLKTVAPVQPREQAPFRIVGQVQNFGTRSALRWYATPYWYRSARPARSLPALAESPYASAAPDMPPPTMMMSCSVVLMENASSGQGCRLDLPGNDSGPQNVERRCAAPSAVLWASGAFRKA